MCLAIPAQIATLLDDSMARVRLGNTETYLTASLMLLPKPAQVGDYVLVHAGFALDIIPPKEAEATLSAVKEFTDAAISE